jgi:hypothetical protein
LPHQPYRWRTAGLMIENVQKSFMHRVVPDSLSY